MPARSWVGACLSIGGCAAVLTVDELEVGELDPPAPAEPPIIPHASAPEPRAPQPDDEATAEAHACIDDMLEDARARGSADGVWTTTPSTAADLSVRRLPDVDGDGEDEWLVTHEADCGVSGNCPYLLYRSLGCVFFAGEFWAAYESVLPRTHRRVHDLEAWTKGGCAGLEGTISRLRWTGTGYQPYETIDCSCDEMDPARHPDCPGAQ
jgi:hypothetical protein